MQKIVFLVCSCFSC